MKEALMVVVVVGGLPGANLATRVPEGVAERDQNLDVSLLRNIRLDREIIQDTSLRLMTTYACDLFEKILYSTVTGSSLCTVIFLQSFLSYHKLSIDHTEDDQWLQERLQIYKTIVSAQQKKIISV